MFQQRMDTQRQRERERERDDVDLPIQVVRGKKLYVRHLFRRTLG